MVRRDRSGYVLIDPQSSEARIYAARAPAGLMAGLRHGRAPGWLAPISAAPGGMRLWRVVG